MVGTDRARSGLEGRAVCRARGRGSWPTGRWAAADLSGRPYAARAGHGDVRSALSVRGWQRGTTQARREDGLPAQTAAVKEFHVPACAKAEQFFSLNFSTRA